MAEQPTPEATGRAELRGQLDALSQLLREADHLEPEAQADLAGLVADLGQALDEGKLDATTVASLTASTRQMIAALRHQHRSLLAAARDGLERVVVQAEDSHPIVTRFAERLIDVLSNLGI
jgi:hypothetical protein